MNEMKNTMITHCGDNFKDAAKRAKELLHANNLDVIEFDFNGISCLVSKDTNMDLLLRDLHNGYIMKWTQIGPDCVEVYEPEVEAELQQRIKLSEERARQRAEERRLEEQNERLLFETKTAGVVLELINQEAWDKGKEVNTDPYGKCIYEYAEGWGKLMQVELANGCTLQECAKRTSFELGFLGISGYMYGAAVAILSQTWKHGEELRKWHNGEYNHEGDGVVNPAVLTIKTRS